MVRGIKKAVSVFGKIEEWILTILFIFAFLVILAQGVSRYVFSNPIIWTDEVSVTMQMILGFLGIGYGIRMKTHIKVDTLSQKFPKKVQALINLVFGILFVIAAVITIQHGIKYATMNWNINFGTFKFGKGKTFLALPIGYALGIIYFLLDMVDDVLVLMGKEPAFNFGKEEEA